jgi:Heterokaryon incompatibility protein (HET)
VLERNHQVNLKSRIYSQASLVVVWPGPEDKNSSIGMKFLNRWRNGSRRPSEDQDDAIEALCSRAYWARLWIVQEIILAKDLLILSCEDECKWIKLEAHFGIYLSLLSECHGVVPDYL